MNYVNNHATDDDGVEFDCIDCELHVVSICPPHNPWKRCHGCQLLAEVARPFERELLRNEMQAIGMIGAPRAPAPPPADEPGRVVSLAGFTRPAQP